MVGHLLVHGKFTEARTQRQCCAATERVAVSVILDVVRATVEVSTDAVSVNVIFGVVWTALVRTTDTVAVLVEPQVVIALRQLDGDVVVSACASCRRAAICKVTITSVVIF